MITPVWACSRTQSVCSNETDKKPRNGLYNHNAIGEGRFLTNSNKNRKRWICGSHKSRFLSVPRCYYYRPFSDNPIVRVDSDTVYEMLFYLSESTQNSVHHGRPPYWRIWSRFDRACPITSLVSFSIVTSKRVDGRLFGLTLPFFNRLPISIVWTERDLRRWYIIGGRSRTCGHHDDDAVAVSSRLLLRYKKNRRKHSPRLTDYDHRVGSVIRPAFPFHYTIPNRKSLG